MNLPKRAFAAVAITRNTLADCASSWRALPRSALAALALAALPLAAAAQIPAKAWSPPRTPDGRPDLQGDWTNSSITTLERSNPSLPLVLSEDQAKQLETQRARQNAAGAAQTNPNQGAPQAGANVGGYNQFWLDRGSAIGRVKGEARSSWIVSPASGRIPFSAEGREKIKTILSKRNNGEPEGLNPADRCFIGSRGSGGPPMLNNIYNNTYQIVQTPSAVMIEVEMMHDARIIRMGEKPRPAAVKQWLGDSIGRWEGDTLVVVTRGWKELQANYEPIYLSEKATVTERFTRTSPDEITYEFTVEDPTFYSQPWKGEMSYTRSSGPVFEYACHEGNYAMPHILMATRVDPSNAGSGGAGE